MFALNICLALNLIILFAAFFFRKHNTLPNKILALILLDNAISFLGNASIVGGYFLHFPYAFFLSWCTSSFLAPLVLTYTGLFTGSTISFKHPVWLLAFFTAIIGFSLPANYLMLPVKMRLGFAMSLLKDPLPWQMTIINIVAMLNLLASAAIAIAKIVQYKKRLVATLSNLEKTKLAFITRFIILMSILILLTSVLYIVLPQHVVEYLYLPCLITLIYFFILYSAFRHHTIFTTETYGQFLQDTLPAGEKTMVDEEKIAVIPPNELQILTQRINEYLEETAAYTDPDITLKNLADGMHVSAEKISAAINKEMRKNFFDLINQKRVDKAKILLSNKINEMTIEAIAYEAGFNSRASFYRAFKKYTTITPSEYLNRSELEA